MASEAPAVIATATDGAREIIEDHYNGLLVPVGDTQRMARMISDLLDDEETRFALKSKARERVRERFSLDRMTDAVEAVYREALGTS